MGKPLSTRIHGILDYLSAPTLFILPRAFGWGKSLTNILTFAAIGTAATSVMTRYELGLYKIIPMRIHLIIDGIVATTIALAPFVLPDQKDRQNNAKSVLLGLGIGEMIAALLTQTVSPVEYKEGTRQLYPRTSDKQREKVSSGKMESVASLAGKLSS